MTWRIQAAQILLCLFLERILERPTFQGLAQEAVEAAISTLKQATPVRWAVGPVSARHIIRPTFIGQRAVRTYEVMPEIGKNTQHLQISGMTSYVGFHGGAMNVGLMM